MNTILIIHRKGKPKKL